jgi:hypothetical protein
MPPDRIVLWAIIAAALLTASIAVFAITKTLLVGERTSSTGDGINTVAGGEQAAKTSERRRSKRFLHRVRVFAYSHAPGETPYHEEAATLEVSSHGGLLTLAANVFVGQKLLLTNIDNQHEQECYVVRFARKHRQKKEVAVEFTQSAPDFWQTRTEHPQEVS